jgi:hypothetical protein
VDPPAKDVAPPLAPPPPFDKCWSRHWKQIHLGLRLKLSPFTRPLALFKVETFQLNLGLDQHSTIIGDQPRYIAVNDEDDIYLTFNGQPTLKDDKFCFLGQEQHTILSKSNPTCVMALFDDEPYAFNK